MDQQLSKNRLLLTTLIRRAKGSLYIPLIFVGVIIVIIIGFALRNMAKAGVIPETTSNQKISVEKPKKTQELKKEYSFPLKDEKGKEVSKVKYTIESAEIRDQIIVKGQKAYAVEGRIFLILNLKITNSYTKPVQINARDYLRLTVDNSYEKVAPEIHNDPVEVQADSTKITRAGFAINENFKSLTLLVGEVNDKKDTIKLRLN